MGASAFTSLGVRFARNLKKYPCFSFGFYMTLFGQYEKHGTLPFRGSLVEQPNYVIELFNTFAALTAERQAKENKKQEQATQRRK